MFAFRRWSRFHVAALHLPCSFANVSSNKFSFPLHGGQGTFMVVRHFSEENDNDDDDDDDLGDNMDPQRFWRLFVKYKKNAGKLIGIIAKYRTEKTKLSVVGTAAAGIVNYAGDYVTKTTKEVVQRGKEIMWGKKKGIRIVFAQDFNMKLNDSLVLESNDLQWPRGDANDAYKAFWEEFLGHIYDIIIEENEDIKNGGTFPLITYEYENTMYIINSVESIKYFMQRFNIKNTFKIGNSENWTKIPNLNIIKLPIVMNDLCNNINLSIEDKKHVQTTLGGNSNCIVLFGRTGVGKSALANVMLGFKPKIGKNKQAEYCGPFEVSDEINSCTKQLMQFSGYELGDGTIRSSLITIIDTPGFDDSDGQEIELLDKAYDFFKRLYYGPNLFVLCLNENERLDDKMRRNIRFLYEMFGNELPKHLLVAITKCDPLREIEESGNGWGPRFETNKPKHIEAIKALMDNQGPLDIVPVSTANSQSSLCSIFDIIQTEQLGRYSSDAVKNISLLQEEQAKAELQKQFQQAMMVIAKLQKQVETLERKNKEKKNDDGGCVIL